MKGKFFKRSKLALTGFVAIVCALIASILFSTFSSDTTSTKTAETRSNKAYSYNYPITGDDLAKAAIQTMINYGGQGLDCSGFVWKAMENAGYSDVVAYSPMTWNSEWVEFSYGGNTYKPTLIGSGYAQNTYWYNKTNPVSIDDVQVGTIVSGTADPQGRGNGHVFIYLGKYNSAAEVKQAIQDKYGITVPDYLIQYDGNYPYWYIEGNGSNMRIRIRNYGWEHTYGGAKNMTYTKLWQITAHPSGSYNLNIAKKDQTNPNGNSLAGAEFKISQKINNDGDTYYYSASNTKTTSDGERFTTQQTTSDIVESNIEIAANDIDKFDYYTFNETNSPSGYAIGGNGTWTVALEAHKGFIGQVSDGNLGITHLKLVANTTGEYNGYQINLGEDAWFDSNLNETSTPENAILHIALDSNGTNIDFTWLDPREEGYYDIELAKLDKITGESIEDTVFAVTKKIGENGQTERIYNNRYYDYDEEEYIDDWRTKNSQFTSVVSSEEINDEGIDTYTFRETQPAPGYAMIGGVTPLELKVYKHKNIAQKYEVEKVVVGNQEIGPNGSILLDEDLQPGNDVTENNYAVKITLSGDRTRIALTWRNKPLSGDYKVFFGKKSSEDLDGPFVKDVSYLVEQYLDIMNVECYDYNPETEEFDRFIRRDIRKSRIEYNAKTDSSKKNVVDLLNGKESEDIIFVEDVSGEKAIDTYIFTESESADEGYALNSARVMIRVFKKISDDMKKYELDYLMYEYNPSSGQGYTFNIQKGQKAWVLSESEVKLDADTTEDEKKNSVGYIEFSADGAEFSFIGVNKPLKGEYSLNIKKVNASNNNTPISDVKFEIDSEVANCLDANDQTDETDANGITKVAENVQITKANVDDVDSYTISEVISSNSHLVKLKDPLTILVYKDADEYEQSYIAKRVGFENGATTDNTHSSVTKLVELEDGTEATVTLSISNSEVTVEVPNKVKGDYGLYIGKKSLEDITDESRATYIGGVKFDVDQYVNLTENAEPTSSKQVTTAEGDLVAIHGQNRVSISDITKKDRYVITEDEVTYFLIKSPIKFVVDVNKKYAEGANYSPRYELDSLEIKAYNGDTEIPVTVERENITDIVSFDIYIPQSYKYEVKDENDQVIFIAVLNGQTQNITFMYGNELKEGTYDFVLTKTDYEHQIIEDEHTKFDVEVYETKTESNDEISFSNPVTLKNTLDQTIVTTNLTATTGKTTGMNGIKINKEDIGKTYYFIVEETVAPDKFTAIDYKVVVPVTFEAQADKFVATPGNAFAIVEENGTYKKKELSELKTEDNEVASLDEVIGVTINLNVPDKPMEGTYNFVLTKTDYEHEIIESERTTFDVDVFATKTENGDQVTFSNPVSLYKTTNKAAEDLIETTNLKTVTGKTTGMNGIAIQPEDIGKTYYFIVEETLAPDKYTEIDYLVAIPVTYSVDSNTNEFVATQGEAFALIPTGTDGVYTKKSLSELKTADNEVASLDEQIGITINLNVPDKRITGDYKIKIRKVNSVTNDPIDGVVFRGTDKDGESFEKTTARVDGENGIAVIAEEHYDDLIQNARYTVTEYELPQAIEGDFLHLTDFKINIDVSTRLSSDGKNYVIDTVQVSPVKINESETFARQREIANRITKSIDETNQVITITIPNEPIVDYSFRLKKFDMENNALAGAEFTIYEDGNIILGTSKTQGAPLDNVGEYLVSRNNQLINSTHVYKIYETKAPVGYENIFEKAYIELVIKVNSTGTISVSYDIMFDSEKGGNITDLVYINTKIAAENPNFRFLTNNGNREYQLNIPNPKGDTTLNFTLTKHEKNSTNGVENAVFNIGKIAVEREQTPDIDAIIARFDNSQVDSTGIITTTFNNSRNLLIDNQSQMRIGDSYYYQISESSVPYNYESKFEKAIVRIHANSDQTITAEIVAVKEDGATAWDKNFSSDDALVLSTNGNSVNLSWENVTSYSIEVIKRKYNSKQLQEVDGDLDRLDTLSGATFTVKRVNPDTKEQIGNTIYNQEVMGDTFDIDNDEANANTTYCYELVEDATVQGYTNIFDGVKIYVYIVTDRSGLINVSNSRIELVGNMNQQKKRYLQDRCSIAIDRSRTKATVNIANEQQTLGLELMKVADPSAQGAGEDLVGISGIEFGITTGPNQTPIYVDPDAQTNPVTDANGYIYVDEIAPDSGNVVYEFEEVSVPQGVTILAGVKIKVTVNTAGMTSPEDISADRITVDVTRNGVPVTDIDVTAEIIGTTIVLKVPNKTTSMVFTLLKKNDEGSVIAGADFTVSETVSGTTTQIFEGVSANGIISKGEIVKPNTTYEFKVVENDPPTPYINVLEGYDLYVHLETDSEGKVKGTEPSASGNSYLRLEARSGETQKYTTQELLDNFLGLIVSVSTTNDNVKSSVTVSVVNPYSYKVQLNKKNGDLAISSAVINAVKVNDAQPGTLFSSTDITVDRNVEKQELKRIVDSTDVSDSLTLNRVPTTISDKNMILYNVGRAPSNDTAQVWKIRETDVDGPFYNILGNNTLIVQTMYRDGAVQIIDHADISAEARMNFYVVDSEGNNLTGDYTDYIDVSLITVDGYPTVSVTVKNPAKMYLDLIKVKYDPDSRDVSRNERLEGATVEAKSAITDTVVAKIENGASQSSEAEEILNLGDRRTFYISEISTVRGYVNVFEGITVEVDLGLNTDEMPTVADVRFKRGDGTYITGDERNELLKYIGFVFGWKDQTYPLIHIYIENPEENPSSYNFELIKKDVDSDKKINGVEFDVTVFDGNNEQVTLKDADTREEINLSSIRTQTINGVDGVISIPNILIEDEGTYTFVLHENPIYNPFRIYKSFAEDIKVKVVIVYENGKYVVKSAEIIQGRQYVEFISVSEDEQQTISAGVLNELVKGRYNIVIDKVDCYDNTKKLDGAVFDIDVFDEYGRSTSLMRENYEEGTASAIPLKNLTATNGTIEINDIDIRIPEVLTLEIKETTAPNKYLKNKESIKVKIITGIEGEYDNARFLLRSAELIGDYDGIATLDVDTNTIHIVISDCYFDLALRKSIESVQFTNGDDEGKLTPEDTADRVPIPDSSKIDTEVDGELITTADYKHVKNHVRSYAGQEVIYTLRVYNEGEVDGYAEEVVDHLPEGLEFVNDDFNAGYGWQYVDGDTTLRTVYTNKLSKANGEETNLIKARNIVTGVLDYKEIKIKCRIKEDVAPGTILTNIAEITRRVAVGYTEEETVDRDNTADAVIPSTKEEMSNYKEDELTDDRNDYVPGQEDDDDFEKLIVDVFDLALRKYITAVNDKELLNTQGDGCTYEREPRVNADALKDGSDTTATYTHTKEPVEVAVGDVVTYRLEVFNEGSISGYASLIKDDIPEGLEFIPNHPINTQYGWKMVDANDNPVTNPSQAKYVVSDCLSKDKESEPGANLIEAFNNTMNKPHSKYVEIAFRVVCEEGYAKIITNEAQIADDTDKDGNPVKDRDSVPNVWQDEDDEDVEHVKVVYMDLALRKFITGVTDYSTGETQEVTSRIPDVNVSKLDTMVNGKLVTTADYTKAEEPVLVHTNDTVIYTIRVYNEGSMDGYATKIKDDIPAGLEYLPDHEINKEYEWYLVDADDNRVTDISKATYIVTEYRSKEKEMPGRPNLIAKFNKETMTEPDHVDVKIAFKVIEPTTSERILINEAQISKQTDTDGTPRKDRDSTPNVWKNEDDEDIEKVKVLYFDLALRKWVTKAIVTIDGNTTVTNTGHKAEDDPEDVVKVDLKKSKVNSVEVKFEYQIRITNEGQIGGWADEVKDYIPEGLRFDPADNPTWKTTDREDVVVTDELKGTYLEPGQSAEVTIVLTWINSESNMGLKVNVAEISKDRNKYDTKDIDSTPNNKVPDEDDIDDAPVMLTLKTGAQTAEYIAIATAVIAILAIGVTFIKKYTSENK